MKKIAALLIAIWVLPGAATAQRGNEPLKILLVKAGRVLDIRAGAYREKQGILLREAHRRDCHRQGSARQNSRHRGEQMAMTVDQPRQNELLARMDPSEVAK